MVVALASSPARPNYGAQPSPAPEPDPARLQSPKLLHSTEQRGQARPTSDLVPILQSLTLFIFKLLNMFIYTNLYSIAKFTFNHNF